MALVYCNECTSKISDRAFDCPTCGAVQRKPTRSFFGKLIKYAFIGFNLLMLWGFLTGIGGGAEAIDTANNEYEQAGATIGTGLGAMLLLFFWAGGALILGMLTLFTRPKAY